jgi:RNase P subunit RPR2
MQPLICFACRQPTKRLDTAPITVSSGDGWRRAESRILAECLNCGTVRARVRFEIELDEGEHPKRSLR